VFLAHGVGNCIWLSRPNCIVTEHDSARLIRTRDRRARRYDVLRAGHSGLL
jgi:hypothetical protein